MRGLQRKAFGFQIAEHGLYRPPLAITRERMTPPARTGQGQEFSRRESHHYEPHGFARGLVGTAEPAKTFDDHFISDFEMACDGGDRQRDKARAQHELIFAQTQDESD